MTDLSRDELRAHLSAVEAQMRAALRIIAAEARTTQQSHSALRADLSAALVRLQSDINGNAGRLDSKVERVLSAITGLGAQRRLATTVLATLLVLFGLLVGLLAGGGWYVMRQGLPPYGVTVPLILDAPPADTAPR